MSVQAIVYSAATGRVRRVIDPNAAVPNALAFIAQAKAGAGEAVLVYTKQGNGLDTLIAWQTAVTAHTGLTPSTDWYCAVDAQNVIVQALVGDPLCGDAIAGATLVQAPWGADTSWTYAAGVFTAPVAANAAVAKIA